MGVAWKYWTHVRLEMSGKLRQQEILVLRAFFQQQLRLEETDELSDALIQTKLFELLAVDAQLAMGCLRCYVSHQIVGVCRELTHKFQLQRYFTQADLWAYVLTDPDPLRSFGPTVGYLPLAAKITQTFQPAQGGLANWTKRLVLQHKDLCRALAGCGIYMASDWAILNHTTSQHLQRHLSGLLSPAQLERTALLLASFHAVYRHERLRMGAGQRCAEPTPDQLSQMANYLSTAGLACPPEQILRNLRALARDLRQPQLRAIPLDESLATPSPQPDEQDEFLAHYQVEVRRCLKRAIRQVFEQRLLALQAANPAKAATFMRALTLFFLDKMSMAQIAPLVGLQKQFQVTRLLNLNGLRAEVRQQWLILMQHQLPQLLQPYVEQERSIQIGPLASLLEESIDQIMAEDRADCYSARSRADSLFKSCLCRYLNEWQRDSA